MSSPNGLQQQQQEHPSVYRYEHKHVAQAHRSRKRVKQQTAACKETSTKTHQKEYLRVIVERALHNDKWRSKLVKMTTPRSVVLFEQAFPENGCDQYCYVGAGSYAHVYRQKSEKPFNSSDASEKTLLSSPPASTSGNNSTSSIIKLIDVYSENVLKNLHGTSSRTSVSTYKEAYNEFKVSLYLSYLNTGLDVCKRYYRCGSFPDVFDIYVVHDSVPKYFANSSEIKQIDYAQLFGKENEEEQNECRSRPMLREVNAKPETAIIKMEDCGTPISDLLSKLRPLQVLSLAKQLLLGFMVAEKVFEFEHRDLHLGNVMVKECEEEVLTYLYNDKIIYLPSHHMQIKLIDTTFSRLKYKNKIFYRNLSHLFNEKEMDKEANRDNPLSHQDQTYRAMAAEIGHDWQSFHPKSNLIWSIYITKKLLHSRVLRKEVSREASQVRQLLRTYIDVMFQVESMHQFFHCVYQKPELNRYVPIKMEDIAF